jgi:hypothetical protein
MVVFLTLSVGNQGEITRPPQHSLFQKNSLRVKIGWCGQSCGNVIVFQMAVYLVRLESGISEHTASGNGITMSLLIF